MISRERDLKREKNRTASLARWLWKLWVRREFVSPSTSRGSTMPATGRTLIFRVIIGWMMGKLDRAEMPVFISHFLGKFYIIFDPILGVTCNWLSAAIYRILMLFPQRRRWRSMMINDQLFQCSFQFDSHANPQMILSSRSWSDKQSWLLTMAFFQQEFTRLMEVPI